MASYLEIAPGVVQVPVLGAQVWLLLDGPLTLVDTGTRGSGRAILRAIERLGRRPADLAAIVLTHYHPDHLGALPELLAALRPADKRGPRVAIHAAEAPFLRAPATMPNPFQPWVWRAVAQPFWPLARLGHACPVDAPLADGDPLPGRADARLVHLPGHTPGSSAVYLPARGVVLAGDAFEARGRLAPPNPRFVEDPAAARASIRKLATLEFDTLAFSHFPPLRRDAAASVRALAATL
ncbi:MAG TPA: MBL fold metallo-hydrolase [Chloroflexota bacterium]|jgi:glyoxylase-like metal-dependent hydrolase (beta-lactamase superfamily II)